MSIDSTNELLLGLVLKSMTPIPVHSATLLSVSRKARETSFACRHPGHFVRVIGNRFAKHRHERTFAVHLTKQVKHNYSHSFENNGVTSEHPKEPESSPFVPRPLSDSWINGVSEQMEGFDKQAGVLEKGDGDGSDCPEHPFSSGDDSHCGSACNPGAGSRFTATDTDVADWARVPGDTSITYGARLYLSNLEPDFSHEENCERVLRPVRCR